MDVLNDELVMLHKCTQKYFYWMDLVVPLERNRYHYLWHSICDDDAFVQPFMSMTNSSGNNSKSS
jgi:hypothetical protein